MFGKRRLQNGCSEPCCRLQLSRRYEMQFVDGVGSCFVTVHMVYISSLKGLRLDLILSFYLFQFNPLNLKIKIWIFLLLPLFISYRSNGEKLIKYQANSSCMIMSVILMTTLLYKALIFQGEIRCWSLLGLKGLRGVEYLMKNDGDGGGCYPSRP